MQIEICRWVANKMLVVLGIMTSVKGPGTLTIGAVHIFCCICCFVFAEYQHIGFNEFFVKVSCLTHESINDIYMALGKHGRNDIPFG